MYLNMIHHNIYKILIINKQYFQVIYLLNDE